MPPNTSIQHKHQVSYIGKRSHVTGNKITQACKINQLNAEFLSCDRLTNCDEALVDHSSYSYHIFIKADQQS